MNTIPTLETLADKAGERGATLGAKDALSGTYMNEANARSLISDILLLYMVFVHEEGDDSDIYTGYILSEFMLAYTFAFYTPFSQNI